MSYTNEGENYRKYGIVIIESYDKTLGYTVYEYRKPTIKERQEIILNYIIEYNNEPIDLLYLSNKLCVSKRTIQKDIKTLQNNNLIEVIPNFTQGSQRRNIIKYIGPQRNNNGTELTLELLYDLDNPYGFRDFDCEEFKINPSLDKRTLKEQYEILKKEKLRLKQKKELFFSKSD